MNGIYNNGMSLNWLVAIILGLLAGAAVNYLADVLPIRRQLAHPFCPECEVDLSWQEYFRSYQRCPNCGRRRSLRVWVVQAAYLLLTIWMWLSPPARLGFWVGLLLLIYFGLVAVIDIEHRLILHPVSLFGMLIGVILGSWLHGIGPTLLGGLAGFGFMFVVYLGGILYLRLVSGSSGEALGFGDVMWSGVLGLMLGWPGIMAGLFVAILSGALVSLLFIVVMLLSRRYQKHAAIPYGPFLVLAGFLLLFFTEGVQSIL